MMLPGLGLHVRHLPGPKVWASLQEVWVDQRLANVLVVSHLVLVVEKGDRRVQHRDRKHVVLLLNRIELAGLGGRRITANILIVRVRTIIVFRRKEPASGGLGTLARNVGQDLVSGKLAYVFLWSVEGLDVDAYLAGTGGLASHMVYNVSGLTAECLLPLEHALAGLLKLTSFRLVVALR